MNTRIILLAGLFIAGLPARSWSADFKFGNQTLTVLDGFQIERVAGPPLVDRPISASFDDQGRLYVTDSSGSNAKPDQQLIEKPHRVVRLEDSDGDGRFDQAIVFAHKMMFPEGCLWLDGSVYISAPPTIWKLTDTDGDGVADRREEWHLGKTLTGCANDLHGPFAGLDGRIYWCKGAFAEQTYPLSNGKIFKSRASHIFRKRPDGSDLEPVLTGGMDNPVSVTFTQTGERLLVGTFFQHPEAGRRDGIIHAIYGGVYGKSNDVLENHPKTGDLMPIMTHLGPAAACSVTRYRSRVFGDDFQENIFVCSFNLHKVTRHVLEPDGATFRTRDSDFLSSDSTDFHPTEVLEDADGSLLIVDTGGWYKLCCPTSQLAKPDVLGAIYRVRRTAAPRLADPRGLKLPWDSRELPALTKLLDDERPCVRDRAIRELAKGGHETVAQLRAVLQSATSAEARRNALWALTRIHGMAARQAVRETLRDPDPSVRACALQSISLWRDREALQDLIDLAQHAPAPLQRIAAEALGRIGDRSAVPILLSAASNSQDRVLEHSLIYALIEIADAPGTFAGLHAKSSFTQRAALIALDQMDGGGIQPPIVMPYLESADPMLKQTAFWIVSHHSDWGSALAGFFRSQLPTIAQNPKDAEEWERQTGQLTRAAAIQELLGEVAASSSSPELSRIAALRAMTQTPLKVLPALWAEPLEKCLASQAESLVRGAIAVARTLPPAKTNAIDLTPQLLSVGRDVARANDLRSEALAAVRPGLPSVDGPLFEFLRAQLGSFQPPMIRATAAGVISQAKWREDQLEAVAELLKSAGPLEISKLLEAFDCGSSESVGLKLVAALKQSKGISGIRPDLLKSKMEKFPPSVREQGLALLSLLNVDAVKQKQHLDELATSLPKGDVRRGQSIFNSAKAACATCHSMGYLGGHVGPDLTSIGQIRTERDLLESIVYPSASFVRSYEPMLVVTKSGEDYSGILRRDTSEEILLVTGPNTEARIARSDIAQMRPGTVSIMPAGLDEQLTHQELADLVAFLKNTKWGPQ